MTLRKQWKNGNLPLPPQRCSKCSMTTQWNRNLTTEMESACKIDTTRICTPQFSCTLNKMQKSHFVLGTLGKCLEMLHYYRDWYLHWPLLILSGKLHICCIINISLTICADRNQNVVRNISNTISFHLELIPFTFAPKKLKCQKWEFGSSSDCQIFYIFWNRNSSKHNSHQIRNFWTYQEGRKSDFCRK
jgi:hypothetical protein